MLGKILAKSLSKKEHNGLTDHSNQKRTHKVGCIALDFMKTNFRNNKLIQTDRKKNKNTFKFIGKTTAEN